MNTFKKRTVALALAFTFLLAGCNATTPETPKPEDKTPPTTNVPSTGEKVDVAIEGFKYAPANLSVKVGTTVTWTNKDTAPHTVTSDEGTLDSDDLGQGASFSFTFTKPGTYNYICAIHPTMKGTVTVSN